MSEDKLTVTRFRKMLDDFRGNIDANVLGAHPSYKITKVNEEQGYFHAKMMFRDSFCETYILELTLDEDGDLAIDNDDAGLAFPTMKDVYRVMWHGAGKRLKVAQDENARLRAEAQANGGNENAEAAQEEKSPLSAAPGGGSLNFSARIH